ncbi:MAG: septal ring lytic transglycosylase RlpA family protein [Chlorobi bacterium]|nr:MAG: rare lipoprotein A [Chlorobi bacterium OLB7]MBK8909699.1 septal ring lytic transglycosylase RlpA family protein [Chlorobiota bacterium]MBX7217531.1 septal ring lytic transglycosylase RlpA family protein [Candidatus Kapabacteria bacterium]
MRSFFFDRSNGATRAWLSPLLLLGFLGWLLLPSLLQGQALEEAADSTWQVSEERPIVTDTLLAPSDTLFLSDTLDSLLPDTVSPDTLFLEEGIIIQLEGEASYYADKFEGRKTSCGETFQQDELTAAHREFPFGTILKVMNRTTGLHTIVRINDRGPWKPSRIIDLSRCAAEQVGMLNAGVANVRIEILRWGP